ncbi:MAG: NADH-quinone oxidoreductase subunit C [Spirosomataceae bacterium]
MTIQEIQALLIDNFGEEIVTKADHQCISVPSERIAAVCQFLFENEHTYFDLLSCLTALDNGEAKGTMEVIYNLYSIPYEHKVMIRIEFPRNQAGESLPKVPSVSNIWRTADWHEREAFDLMGIEFIGHQDLRRILLPEDWEGHPLRKDYQEQEYYHGIKVKY